MALGFAAADVASELKAAKIDPDIIGNAPNETIEVSLTIFKTHYAIDFINLNYILKLTVICINSIMCDIRSNTEIRK